MACNFIYIGKRLPSSTSKHFEVDWVEDEWDDKKLDSGEQARLNKFNTRLVNLDENRDDRGLLVKQILGNT